VNHALVGAVVQIDKVLLSVGGNGLDVHGVSVVLGGDVAASGGHAQHGNVMGMVSVLELDGHNSIMFIRDMAPSVSNIMI
jgi:hypothetical protein